MKINVDDMVDMLVEGSTDIEQFNIVEGIVSGMDIQMAYQVKDMVDEHILRYQRKKTKCSNCKHELFGEEAFCPECGSRVGIPKEAVKEKPCAEVFLETSMDRKPLPKLMMLVVVSESGHEYDYGEVFQVTKISRRGDTLYVGGFDDGWVLWDAVTIYSTDGAMDTKYQLGDTAYVKSLEMDKQTGIQSLITQFIVKGISYSGDEVLYTSDTNHVWKSSQLVYPVPAKSWL